MTTPTLYEWPRSAHFGQGVPKKKFYEHAKIGSAVRDKFVGEVQRITLAYKLAEPTVNLRSSEAVPEIRVFCIDAKGDDVSDAVLTAIDRSVPFPVIFEVSRGEGSERHIRTAAAHKELAATPPRLTDYFTTEWLASDAERRPMPPALDLSSLYAALLSALLPVARRDGEPLTDAAARVESIRQLEREVARLERRLATEPQFNRKVELRRELRAKNALLADLTAPIRTNL